MSDSHSKNVQSHIDSTEDTSSPKSSGKKNKSKGGNKWEKKKLARMQKSVTAKENTPASPTPTITVNKPKAKKENKAALNDDLSTQSDSTTRKTANESTVAISKHDKDGPCEIEVSEAQTTSVETSSAKESFKAESSSISTAEKPIVLAAAISSEKHEAIFEAKDTIPTAVIEKSQTTESPKIVIHPPEEEHVHEEDDVPAYPDEKKNESNNASKINVDQKFDSDKIMETCKDTSNESVTLEEVAVYQGNIPSEDKEQGQMSEMPAIPPLPLVEAIQSNEKDEVRNSKELNNGYSEFDNKISEKIIEINTPKQRQWGSHKNETQQSTISSYGENNVDNDQIQELNSNHAEPNAANEANYSSEINEYSNEYPRLEDPIEMMHYSTQKGEPVPNTYSAHSNFSSRSPVKDGISESLTFVKITEYMGNGKGINVNATESNAYVSQSFPFPLNGKPYGGYYEENRYTKVRNDSNFSDDERAVILSSLENSNANTSSSPNRDCQTRNERTPKIKKKKAKKGKQNKNRKSSNTSIDEHHEKSSDHQYNEHAKSNGNQEYWSTPTNSPSPNRPTSAFDNSTAVTPLNVDQNRVIGKGRGIDGANNSCYMDSTLFSLFYATDVFDDRLLTEAGSKGFPTQLTKDVQAILKDQIVYPLRQGYYCPSNNVWKLRKAMKNLNTKLCGSFMDAEEFIFLLFEDALNVNEFIHYTTGTSDFMHQIIIDYNDSRKFVTTQYLYENSMKILDDLKLQSVPSPALILEMPRSNRILVQYKGIVPNLQIDLNNVIVQCALDNSTTDIEISLPNNSIKKNESVALQIEAEPKKAIKPVIAKRNIGKRCVMFASRVFRPITSTITYFTPNCIRPFIGSAAMLLFRMCVFIYALGNPTLVQDTFTYLMLNFNESGDSGEETYSDTNDGNQAGQNDVEAGLTPKENPPPLGIPKTMDLIAVICINGCHYTSFVRHSGASDSGDATWLFFDSMAGGGPEVEEVRDCEKWLRRLEKEPEKTPQLWNELPWGVRKIISDSHICIYKPTQTSLERVSDTSYTIENEHGK